MYRHIIVEAKADPYILLKIKSFLSIKGQSISKCRMSDKILHVTFLICFNARQSLRIWIVDSWYGGRKGILEKELHHGFTFGINFES